jgi:2-dehydro-3-deoxyphosphogluconate aldolase/(4S)-4-hydroxy-2-oxoglutarate aldolase
MGASETLKRLIEVGVVPVVRAPSADTAHAAVDAVGEGGIPCVEITMTVPGAVGVIEQVRSRFDGHALVGAGTVTDAETARACIDAGAEFVVCPILDLETIALCRELNTVVIPGALTPTEIFTAWKAGAEIVKVFPCDSAGGAKHIRSVRAPFPQIPLLPTGGVTLDTAADFFAAGATAVGVGSDLVDVKALLSGNSALVVEKARQYAAIARSARPHV